MFIKRHQLEYAADKALVRVTASTPLYMVISKSSAAVALVDIDTAPVPTAQPLEEEDTQGLDLTQMYLAEQIDPHHEDEVDDDDEEDDRKDDDCEEDAGDGDDEYPPTAISILGGITGGVWMGGPSQAPDIQLKMRKSTGMVCSL